MTDSSDTGGVGLKVNMCVKWFGLHINMSTYCWSEDVNSPEENLEHVAVRK